MKFEIWSLVQDDTAVMPLVKLYATDSISDDCINYVKLSKDMLCMLMASEQKSGIDQKYVGTIYESPDKGKTVYKRQIGSLNRELVKH